MSSLILSLDAAANFNQYGIYRYKKLANESTYLNGEFNCARMVDQMATENGVSPVSRITAVGRVGYNATFPGLSDAITMNTANLGATPSWTKLHSVDFKGLTGTATNAKWFVPQPNAAGIATLGEYVYIGNQTSGGVYRDVVCGGLRKTDGATECSIDPYFVSVDNPSPEGPYEEAYTLLWGTDENERTISSQIYLTPFHCDRSSPYQFYTISYGKRARDHEVVSVIEQAEKHTIEILSPLLYQY
ncbi:MAG: hypothetical protein IPM69_06235 [Ignavibacteria bacterium]|nr:hypothetical protein [Ignavibacteria bacterium]